MKNPVLLAAVMLFMLQSLAPETGWAVVGMAEQYDEFKAEDLEEFHEFLLREETHRFMKETLGKYGAEAEALEKGEEEMKEEGLLPTAAIDEEEKAEEEFRKIQLQALRDQLLFAPKKDRFKLTSQGDYKYHSNVNRDDKLEEANDDSIFEAEAIAAFDFSGKKTDLRLDLIYGRQWNWEFSERDFYQTGARVRYRRQYFTKMRHSTQLNLTRHNSKTVEIDSNKIRWDFAHRNTLNYAFSRKTELNLDFGGSKRLFTQEAFDQDSQWQVDFSPSFLWNFTPKSRISGGYEFGASRIRSKSGDANSHAVALNYFGRITSKSSTSFDIAYERQVPRSTDTAKVRTITTGLGFIYQLTPKTQITSQIFRSLQNTTANLASGEVDGENTTTKTDTHFTNNSVTVSINSNLNRRLNANLSFNAAYQTTETFEDGDKDDETWQFSYPMSLRLRYVLTRWLIFNLGYTLDIRKGKKDESYKNHVINFTATAVF